MSFNPNTNKKNQIPDILSQAELVINNFISKPPKNKKLLKNPYFLICSFLVLWLFLGFIVAFIK